MTLSPRSTDAFQYRQSIIGVALVVLLTPAVAWAQDASAQDAPAHLSAVEGIAAIDREGDTISAVAGEVVLEGDRLRTESGRAELWFPDGSILDVDERSVVELQSESLIRLMSGRILLSVGRTNASPSDTTYQVDTPAGTVTPNGSGEYKVAVSGAPGDEVIELQVIRGAAQLIADGGSLLVRSGQQSFARINSAPSRTEIFNSARYDAFDRWIAAQRDDTRGRAVSTQYLPPNLRMYGGTFDQYGSWDYEPSYGYIWYPTVAATWRPYYHGYWRPVPRYGWTWIGADVWGWPTHHYGRWGYKGARWFWVPERRFAPAYVSWASAADYVSWCPLGFDNRPVFGFSIATGNTWGGWTVMPRSHFGVQTAYVNRYAVDGWRLPHNTAFAVHSQTPFVPAFRGSDRRQFTIRTDGQDRGGFTRPGMAVPRYPQARTNDGTNPARGSTGLNAEPPVAGDVRTRAYRRDPRTNPPDPSANRTDGSGGTRSVLRYRVPRQQPIPAGDVTSRPTRPEPTPVRPSAPEASGVAPSAGRAEPRAPQADNGWSRPAPRTDNAWGRSAPASNPARSSASPDNGPSRRESGASAPPRESAPPSGGAGRAVPRGESGGGSSGSGSAGSGGGRPAGGNGGGRPAGGTGGGGHGPRHP